MLCEGFSPGEGTCALTLDSVTKFGLNTKEAQIWFRKQTLHCRYLSLLPFKRKCLILLYCVLYIVHNILSFYPSFYILYYTLSNAYLYYIVKESLSAGLIVFFNCVLLIDKIV